MFMKILSICIMLTMVLFILSSLMKMSKSNLEKFSPFECGFENTHENRNSFSLRFFILTIIFLIFDTEVTLLLPLPLIKNEHHFSHELYTHVMLWMILCLGLLFEWKQGALNWMWFYI